MKVEYSSNNSGGNWWLSDEDWIALEKAGWNVEWRKNRFLGALATEASRTGLNLMEAVSEWESVTNLNSLSAGCPCCGPPHNFTLYDDNGNYIDSGPSADYTCGWD